MSKLQELKAIYQGAYVRSGTLVATVVDVGVTPDVVLIVHYPDGQEDIWYLKDTFVEPISKKEYFAASLKYKRPWA